MIMKRIALLLIGLILAIPTVVEAQQRQQRAIVKTRGRLQDDGSVVEGRRIEDALVVIRDGAKVYSGADGELSFSVSQVDGFYIANITKTGYTLSDADVISRPHKYQSQPMDLLLESVDELRAYRRDIERKVRRNYQRQLDLAYDRIDSLESSSTVNAQEIAKLRAEIDRSYDLAEKYIEDMTERYLNIDFDRESDFDREISFYILNGELDRADSMLATRGDIVERVNQNLMAQKAVEQDREQVAKDCYRKYEIADQRHEREEAAKYLKLRAALDPHDINWQIDAAEYISVILAEYDEALSIFESALSYAIEHYGEDHFNVGLLCGNIGKVYYYKGDLIVALDYYQKSLAKNQSNLGEWHPLVAIDYNHIGLIYSDKGDYSTAFDYYQKALAIREKVLGVEHPDVVSSYNSIGGYYAQIGDYNKALDFLQKALTIQERVTGAEHQNVAILWNNIGFVYRKLGDYNTALDYHQKALSICEKVLGAEHPDTAASYSYLGMIYFENDDYDTALSYLLKGLAVREKVLGTEHPDVALSYGNIGLIYTDKGDYDTALSYHHKALALCEKVFGHEHFDVATIYNNIGYTYALKGNSAAASLDPQSVANFERALGLEPSYTPTSNKDISAKSDYEIALEYYQKALAIREKVYGADHNETLSTRETIELIKAKL